MIKNFTQFIFESSESGYLPPLVDDFLNNVEILDPEVTFEDWWCSSQEELFLSYFQGSVIANITAAENEEREERKKIYIPKNTSPYFLLEFVSRKKNKMFEYFVVGIDMKKKEFFTSKVPGDYLKDFEFYFGESLKKNYPTIYAAKKYGL